MLRSNIDTPRTFTRALCVLPKLARILDERPPAMMSAAVITSGCMLEREALLFRASKRASFLSSRP